MASRSAVVSTITTSITKIMDRMGTSRKVGVPKKKGGVKPTAAAVPTVAKDALPNSAATTVPKTSPSSTAMRPQNPLEKRVSSSTNSRVSAARPRLPREPKSGAAGLPPPAQRIATGSSETPMMVITVPVTTGGKKRSSREKKGAAITVKIPAAITAP